MLNRSQILDDKAPNKRQLSEQAIALALQGRWEDAVQVNRRLVTFYPHEADAHNRLGKALTELGRYREARDAYAQALQADPGNGIARRNLDRLRLLADRDTIQPAGGAKGEKMDPRLFVEEPGKTVVVGVQHPAPAHVLVRMNSGDLVRLHANGRALIVENAAGEALGEVEPKLAQRLINFMQAGNQYVAAVKSLDERDLRIFIRETAQHPSLAGRPSFPTRAEGAHRGYTRDTLVRNDYDDDDEEYDDAEGDYVERERHEDDADEEETGSMVHELDRGFDLEQEEE